MSNNSLEIVHEGWLTKSPPPTSIFAAQWRKRWFVLKQTGELPGQYFLFYYTDQTCRKLKGRINLDECEQVDTGLRFVNNKHKYQHMFDVRTPKRTYYLAADTEDDMNKWVKCVCQVCGFRAYTADDTMYNYSPTGEEGPSTPSTVTETLEPSESESPPVSPTSTSSAYIPISECITGPPVSLTGPTASWRATAAGGGVTVLHQLPSLSTMRGNVGAMGIHLPPGITADEFYDCPRQLRPRPPAALDLRQGQSVSGGSAAGEWDAQRSPGTDAESVFTDDEWAGGGGGGGGTSNISGPRPAVNWETFPANEGDTPVPRPSDSSTDLDLSADASWGITNRYGRIAVSESKNLPSGTRSSPPPRPPKPSHLLLDPSASAHNYLNIENVSPGLTPGQVSDDAGRRHKNDSISASGSEPPSPLVATSTPLDGPSALPTTGGLILDEMYDFPRSHQYPDGLPSAADSVRPVPSARHCYSNAAPGQVNGDVFTYDFQQDSAVAAAAAAGASCVSGADGSCADGTSADGTNADGTEEPTSPRSEGSSITSTQYSNLPSPSVHTPPAVNRGLKPRRKMSDSAASSEPSPGLASGPGPLAQSMGNVATGPPNVDRKLKPRKHSELGSLTLAAVPPGRRRVVDGNCTRSLRRVRGPTSTLPSSMSINRSHSEHCSSSDDDHRNSPDDDFCSLFQQDVHAFMSSGKEIKYLDLDLDKDSGPTGGSFSSALPSGSFHSAPKSPEKGATNATATVYKTVDFVKTEAFNRTRLRVEKERYRGDKAPASLGAK